MRPQPDIYFGATVIYRGVGLAVIIDANFCLPYHVESVSLRSGKCPRSEFIKCHFGCHPSATASRLVPSALFDFYAEAIDASVDFSVQLLGVFVELSIGILPSHTALLIPP